MSILSTNSKRMLVESMREYMRGILMESSTLTSKQATDRIGFLCENATYEQLLNITLNPSRDTHYLPSYVLEGAVAILHRACLTGRRKIGVNAITEGALKLHKETGAVITESMLDAALNTVNNGSGLKIVGKILTEAPTPVPAPTTSPFANAVNALTNFQFNMNRNVGLDIADVTNKLRAAGITNPQQVIDSVSKGGDIRNVLASSIRQAQLDRINSFTALNGINGLADSAKFDTTKFGGSLGKRIKRIQSDATLNPGQKAEKLRAIIDGLKKGVEFRAGSSIQKTVSPNSAQAAADSIIQQARNRGGSGWKTAGVLAGGAALLGTGAMLYNRYKKNQAAAQQAQQ